MILVGSELDLHLIQVDQANINTDLAFDLCEPRVVFNRDWFIAPTLNSHLNVRSTDSGTETKRGLSFFLLDGMAVLLSLSICTGSGCGCHDKGRVFAEYTPAFRTFPTNTNEVFLNF